MTTQSDSKAEIDDSATTTTEPSETVISCEIPNKTAFSKVRKHKALSSDLSQENFALDEHELLRRAYIRLKGGNFPEQHRSYSIIPKFYIKPPNEESFLAQKLREEARSRFLREKSTQLLDNQEVPILNSIE